MPSHDFNNLGDVLDFDIIKGTIIDVNSSDDTCTVRLVGESGAKTALLFYHCEPDSILRDNGAIEGAAAGFAEDDEVIVMQHKDLSVIKVIGHIYGVRKCKGIYIILIPDLIRGFQIQVNRGKNNYEFSDMSSGVTGVIRYEFDKDYAGITGDIPRQQYMPYIFKRLGTSHVSVGDPGSSIYPDPVNDWHSKFYVLDCTGDQAPAFERLWRPPSQIATVGFGEDLLPVWYAMSPITAHNFHWCFESAIDQSKRIYQPINTDVVLASAELVIPDFTIVFHDGLRYNFLYPLKTARFYGKNAFDYTTVDGKVVTTAFGESIYLSGVVTASIPEGIDPILFFWPWIPYLDEIRSFNILSYGGRSLPFGGFDGFYMTPMLDTFKKYGIGYYTNTGEYQTQELFEDIANFSEVTKSNVNSSSGGAIGCGCGDCATGSWLENTVANVPPYNSSGTKNIPIGLIGGKIPISMKTTWSQSGSGPQSTDINTDNITGNYPWGSLHSGSIYGLCHWYETCCITNFHNDHNRVKTYTESASNHLTMQQVLKVGEDVIFEGESSMNYEMEYNYEDRYDGSITGTVVPPDFVPPVCAGSISYTTQQMSVNQTQNLRWNDDTAYPAARPCEEAMTPFTFTWALSGGGSLSSTTDQNTIYTAPATNPNCANNATISLLCDGVVVDTLEIVINGNASNPIAIVTQVCVNEPRCLGTLDNCWPCEGGGTGVCAEAYGASYRCDGTQSSLGWSTSIPAVRSCYGPAGGCRPSCAAAIAAYCDNNYPGSLNSCENACSYYNGTWIGAGITGVDPAIGTYDVRTQEMKDAGCCPAALL